MSKHYIQFYEKNNQIFLNICSLLSKEFRRTQKRAGFSHGKRAIGVRAIVVQLYLLRGHDAGGGGGGGGAGGGAALSKMIVFGVG